MSEAVEDGLDGFGPESLRAVALAEAEARSAGSSRLGTEHLLLGLLGDSEGGAARLLGGAGVTLAAARRKVAEAVGQRPAEPDTDARSATGVVGAIERSPRAERALGRAFRFSREGQSREVTSEHLLLGVLDVEGTAGQVLRGLGIDLDNLRATVESRGDDPAGGPAAGRGAASDGDGAGAGATGATGAVCATCSTPLDGTLEYSVLAAAPTAEGGRRRDVTVVWCRACGAALGIAR